MDIGEAIGTIVGIALLLVVGIPIIGAVLTVAVTSKQGAARGSLDRADCCQTLGRREMRRVVVLALGLVFATTGVATGAQSGVASGATASERTVEVAAKRFRNCTQLNKRYPQGVGKRKAVNRVNGRRTSDRNHKKSDKLYRANSHLDRDKDGVACER